MKKFICFFILFVVLLFSKAFGSMSQINIIAQSVRHDISNQPDRKMVILDSGSIVKEKSGKSYGYIAFIDGSQIVFYVEDNLLKKSEIKKLSKTNICKITAIKNPRLRYIDENGETKYGNVVLQAIRCRLDNGMINGRKMKIQDNLKFWLDYIKSIVNPKEKEDLNGQRVIQR